jgi:muconolactone delta-isomerase
MTLFTVALSAQAVDAPANAPSAASAELKAPSPPGRQLRPLLDALGKAELEKEALAGCSYRERTRVEELTDKGEVKGTLERSWKVVRKGDTSNRTLLESNQTGDLSDMLTREPKEPTPEERKAQRSPLHPEQQPLFTFSLLEEKDGRIQLGFRPKKRDAKWMQGSISLNAESLELVSMKASPSKMPPMVSSLDLDLRFTSTACGVQPNQIRVRGRGGFLFMKLNFRSDTRLDGFEVP